MKLTIFLISMIGLCVFVVLFSLLTIAIPEDTDFNWIVSFIITIGLEAALTLSKNQKS